MNPVLHPVSPIASQDYGQGTSPASTVSTTYEPVSPARSNIRHRDGDNPPPKKKQKRNKPTLSCEECVERKTKVGSETFSQSLCRVRLSLSTVAMVIVVIMRDYFEE